jgi:ABC-2 type transport system ATP-binding protein
MILLVKNLTKKFSSFVAVDNISFSLKKGEVLAFLGHNGAGKTTTIQMLLGILTPSFGDIVYFGNNFGINQQKALQKIGYASGYDKLPGRLTVFENLDVVGRIYDIPNQVRQERIYFLLNAFGMDHIIDKQCSGLSAGQSTCVMLAKAFIANPELVLLDEPTASLDPETAYKVRQFIIKKNIEDKTSILITSHNMNEVSELCDRVIILKNGKIIANDTPLQLVNSIKKNYIDLIFDNRDDIEICKDYLNKKKIDHTIIDLTITLTLLNKNVSLFLSELFEKKIIFSDILLKKPTLEDYFLSCGQQEEI